MTPKSEPPKPEVDLEATCQRLLDKIKVVDDPTAIAAAKADEKRQHDLKVMSLRYGWNAPKRHVCTTPQLTGQWGDKLTSLSDKLGSGMFVAIVGSRGAGKTQMAVELMRRATERLFPAKFLTSTAFFMRLKATFHVEQETELDIIKELSKLRLLVIDEAGKRGQTDWENNVLFELLNRRYNEMMDTVLLDNNDPDAFCASIGPSLASRLNETGGIIHATWPSFRTD